MNQEISDNLCFENYFFNLIIILIHFRFNVSIKFIITVIKDVSANVIN